MLKARWLKLKADIMCSLGKHKEVSAQVHPVTLETKSYVCLNCLKTIEVNNEPSDEGYVNATSGNR